MRSHGDLGSINDNGSCFCSNRSRSSYSGRSRYSDCCFVAKKVHRPRSCEIRMCRVSMRCPLYSEPNSSGDCPTYNNYCLLPLDPVNGFQLVEYADKSCCEFTPEIMEKKLTCESVITSCCCDRKCEIQSQSTSLPSSPRPSCLKTQFSKSTASSNKSAPPSKSKRKKCTSSEKKKNKSKPERCTCKSGTIVYFQRSSPDRMQKNCQQEKLPKLESNDAALKKPTFFERIKSIFKK